MNARLSEGYYSRPVTIDDAAAVVEIYNAESRWLNGANSLKVEEVRADWESPMLSLETDSMAVFTSDHQPVGHVEFWDMRVPHVHLFAYATVHPEHLNRGVGSYLAGWLAGRALNNLPKAPEDTRVVLHQFVQTEHQPAKDLLTHQGYRPVRNSYRMQINFDHPPAVPVVPQGIMIRSISGEEDEKQALFVRHEAFMDHWGALEEPFTDYYKRWKYFIDHDPDHDPSLWFIALDGDQVAGISLCHLKSDDDPQMGWVGSLGVRRPWRKRGLGLALLQHSFYELYQRGQLRAGLGVDASSLTGATRLYEHAGMHVSRTIHIFELELRPGKDLTRQALDPVEKQ